MSRGTTRRSIRLEDELWAAATAKAATEGTDVSSVVRTALADYVAAKAPRKPRKAASTAAQPSRAAAVHAKRRTRVEARAAKVASIKARSAEAGTA